MSISNRRIPHRAFAILVPAMILEAGIIVLPAQIIAESGPWGWLAFLLAAAVVAADVTLIMLLLRRHRFAGYPDLARKLLGPGWGRVFLIVVGLALALRAARIARITTELITQQLLFRTPQWAVLLSGLVVVALIARRGFEPVARFAAITFPFYYAFMLLAFGFALLRADYTHLVDLSRFSPEGLWRGVVVTLANFQGYTMLLIFLPWSRRAGRALPPVLLGVGLVGLLVFVLMLATIGVLGPAAAQVTWPTLQLIEVVSAPGLLVERAEALFFAVWLFAVVMVQLLTLFGAAYTLSAGILGRPAATPFTVPAAAGVAVLALLPRSMAAVQALTSGLMQPLGLFDVSLPLVLWVLTWLRAGSRGP